MIQLFLDTGKAISKEDTLRTSTSFEPPSKMLSSRVLLRSSATLRKVDTKTDFTTVLNHIIPVEVSPLADEMTSHGNMRIRTALSNRKEILSAINALRWIKSARLDAPPAELIIVAPAVSINVLLPLYDNFGNQRLYLVSRKSG